MRKRRDQTDVEKLPSSRANEPYRKTKTKTTRLSGTLLSSERPVAIRLRREHSPSDDRDSILNLTPKPRKKE